MVAALASGGVGASAHAQERVPPTQLQRELYGLAFQAYRLDRFDDAIIYLEAATAVQPFDLFYYSMGRAHFKRGRCFRARDAYQAALGAPAYEQASESMADRVDAALTELEQACPGELRTVCATPGVEIVVDDRPPAACGAVIKLPPGHYQMRARLGAKEQVEEVRILAVETTSVEIGLTPEPQVVVERVVEPTTPWLPPTLLTAGGLLLAGSVAVDALWLGPSIDQFEAMRQRPTPADELAALQDRIDATQAGLIGTYAVSALLIAGGGGLWLWEILELSEPETSAPNVALTPTLGVGHGGASCVVRW